MALTRDDGRTVWRSGLVEKLRLLSRLGHVATAVEEAAVLNGKGAGGHIALDAPGHLELEAGPGGDIAGDFSRHHDGIRLDGAPDHTGPLDGDGTLHPDLSHNGALHRNVVPTQYGPVYGGVSEDHGGGGRHGGRLGRRLGRV